MTQAIGPSPADAVLVTLARFLAHLPTSLFPSASSLGCLAYGLWPSWERTRMFRTRLPHPAILSEAKNLRGGGVRDKR